MTSPAIVDLAPLGRPLPAGKAVLELLAVHRSRKALRLEARGRLSPSRLAALARGLSRERERTGARWSVSCESDWSLPAELLARLPAAGIERLRLGRAALSLRTIDLLKQAAEAGLRLSWTLEDGRAPADASLAHLAPPQAEDVSPWRRDHPRSFFFFARGADFLDLVDGRPSRWGSGIQILKTRVAGLEAFLLGACARPARLAELRARCADLFPAPALEPALKRMEQRRWLRREGGAVLALALPKAALSPAQRCAYWLAGVSEAAHRRAAGSRPAV